MRAAVEVLKRQIKADLSEMLQGKKRTSSEASHQLAVINGMKRAVKVLEEWEKGDGEHSG